MTTRRFLSTPQVGEQLGVSDDTVREWIHARELRAVNVATKPGDLRWRVRDDWLTEFLRGRERTPRLVSA